MASHYTDPETELMFFVRGGGQNLVSTHNKRMNLALKNDSLSGNTWSYATGFQPIATLGVPKPRGIETMFWAC
jgi:hypothetical protein